MCREGQIRGVTSGVWYQIRPPGGGPSIGRMAKEKKGEASGSRGERGSSIEVGAGNSLVEIYKIMTRRILRG